MARKKQQLINYHTSKAIMPQAVDVQLGEIVVRHATDKPELLIKKDNNEFATFVDSGKVQSMITTSSTDLQGKIDAVSDNLRDNYATSASTESAIATAKSEAVSSGKGYTDAMVAGAKKAASDAIATTNSNLSTLSGSVDSFSATVVSDYATKVIASGYAMTAEANAVASGKGYTDAKVEAAERTASSAISAVEGKIESLSGSVSAFSATVVNDYATKVIASGYAMTAEANAVASGKGYTDGEITKVTTAYTKADTELENKITSLSGSVSALSEELRNEIADKVSSAYIYKGSVSDVSNLPPTGNVKGDVYNVINANGAPGDDNYTPAGTNYAWDGEKWDALGGVVDLSNYATTATTHDISTGLTALQSTVNEFSGAVKTKFNDYATSADTESAIATAKSEAVSSGKGYTDAMVDGAKKAASDAIATTNSNLSTLSGSVGSFSATVVSDYATKVIASGYAMTAEANAVASGKGYTDGEITKVTTAYTKADNDLDARIDKLEAISAHTQSAVQNVVVANTDANKITATKTDENNVVTLNFDNMVIDCGDF